MNKNKSLELVAEAIAFIDRNLSEEISVSTVCSKYSMSPWEFQRMFRAVTLDSIGNYIRTRRLSQAADLISGQKGLKIIDVALEVGFGSPEAFTRSFKDHFGVSPLEWKKRQSNKKIKRIPITIAKLDRLKKGIVGPKLVEMEERIFVGMTTTIISPFGHETDFDKRIPSLWLEFNKRRAEIPRRKKAVGFGIAIDFYDRQGTEQMTYMASAQVEEEIKTPLGMKQVFVPAGTYATFETRGRIESSHATYDFIYGVWLPNSPFRRSSTGYDIEIFDHRFQMEGENSLSTFCIPIEKH